MLIREFLCVLEYGLMLFHVNNTSHEHSEQPDQFLRTNLISALYSFVSQVEGDTIDALCMGKVTLLFQKRSELIFILTLDSSIDANWCEVDFQNLLYEFFQAFPEVQWQHTSVLDLRTFEPFKTLARRHLRKLNRRLELLKLLLDERLISKDEYPSHSLDCLGTIVASRLLQKHHSQVIEILRRNLPTLPLVDKFLDGLDENHVIRTDNTYVLDRTTCDLCDTGIECFFEAFLESISMHLGCETHVSFSQMTFQKHIHISSTPDPSVFDQSL
ncbi:MAG: hypothetical protein ACFFDT_16460 [Candidatus Hodarchaeota archaeon]